MINFVSITDLKQNTSKVIKRIQEKGESVVIMQRSKPTAVLVDPDRYDILEESYETMLDLKAIEERKNDETTSFEKYFEKRFGKNAKKSPSE